MKKKLTAKHPYFVEFYRCMHKYFYNKSAFKSLLMQSYSNTIRRITVYLSLKYICYIEANQNHKTTKITRWYLLMTRFVNENFYPRKDTISKQLR